MFIDKLATEAEARGNGGVAECMKPCLLSIIGFFLAIQPWFAFVGKYGHRLWEMLPTNVALMMFGAAMCYFGGSYTASIAAIEAFRTMGYERAKTDIDKVVEQLREVAAANAADNLVDDDGDGIADVDQTPPNELMRRKLVLVMSTIDEPGRINAAIASWAALLAVLATLRLEFAASTAIALGIVDMIKFPMLRLSTPGMLALLGPTLKHWCEPLIEFGLAFIAIIFGWWAKAMLAALYAAVRGGRLFAQGFFGLIVDQARKGVQICPGLVNKDFGERVGLGRDRGLHHRRTGLHVPVHPRVRAAVPTNILLLPLSIVEWILGLRVSSTSSVF